MHLECCYQTSPVQRLSGAGAHSWLQTSHVWASRYFPGHISFGRVSVVQSVRQVRVTAETGCINPPGACGARTLENFFSSRFPLFAAIAIEDWDRCITHFASNFLCRPVETTSLHACACRVQAPCRKGYKAERTDRRVRGLRWRNFWRVCLDRILIRR